MRVLYFHQHFSTRHGSTGIRSYEMARHLLAKGHQVTMVCGSYQGASTGLLSKYTKGQRRGTVDGIEVIEFDLAYANKDGLLKRSLTFLKFAWCSIKLIFTERYDLVFATSTPLTAGIPGIFARWLKLKPFVFEVRDLWPELPKAMGVVKNPVVLMGLSFLEYMTYFSAQRLIGLSPGIVEGIERRGVKREQVAMISNGCDLDLYEQTISVCRPEGIEASDLMAIYTGTHGLANGLEAILEAALELKRRGRSEIKLVLIGEGKLKPSLIQRAQVENLQNIIFLDPVDKLHLAGLMATADIGIQTLADVPAFYYGTSPNKFFDYIACGLPVLNNYPGWVADMIHENQCGFVVPPQDASAFADALEQAADNRTALKLMGKNARRVAENQFNRVKLAEQFVGWLESSLSLS